MMAINMKTIGLIGGMSAESTVLYYQIINREVNRRLGRNHSARVLMHSVDFEEVVALQQTGDWAQAGFLLARCAHDLQAIGADMILLCTNTMHKVAAAIEAAVDVPFLHVVDETAARIRAVGFFKVGLLGTRFTMSDGFYAQRMARHGVTVLTPKPDQQDGIHRIIFDELCLGLIRPASRQFYQQAMADLQQQGAQAVILGCTEIGLLLGEEDALLPLFDSTQIHALAAVDAALALS